MLFILLLMVLSIEGTPVLHGTNSGSVQMKNLKRHVHNPGKYPFLVHLKIVTGRRGKEEVSKICGGVLIRTDLVLSAGHCLACLNTKLDITAVAGAVHLTAEKTAQYRNVKEYEIHEVYEEFKVGKKPGEVYPEDDIAMLWLNMPFKLNNVLKLAKLPKPNSNVHDKVGTVVGWGLTEMGHNAELLKEGRMKVVANTVCSKAYSCYFTNKAICILSDDLKITACDGDSGGPFVVKGVVEGIISFGATRDISCPNGKVVSACDPQSPVIVTRVEAYLSWISYRVQNGSPSERRELEHVQSIIGSQNPKQPTKQPGKPNKKCDKKTKKCTIL